MHEPKLHVSVEIHLKINTEHRNKIVKKVSNGYHEYKIAKHVRKT